MKYAIVGTGSRHLMFRDAVISTFADTNELVALCDSNPHRLALSAGQTRQITGKPVAAYAADDFDRMLEVERPDVVVVTVPDYMHDRYIARALALGCDVITEKPMTIDIGKLRNVLEAKKKTGKSITVSFNYRYAPHRTQVKDILMSGAIGEITAVDFRWYLDRVHGADYFRRWHRYKDRSGGLLVHKATHHFDLVNWWIGSTPKTVHAFGKRAFYRPEMANSFGLTDRGERCHTCPAASRCDYRLDLAEHEGLKQLYLDGESHDGYFRDRCVFADDITIEDTMQVQVAYASGATMNYTLVAYSPVGGAGDQVPRHQGRTHPPPCRGARHLRRQADARRQRIHRHRTAPCRQWPAAGRGVARRGRAWRRRSRHARPSLRQGQRAARQIRPCRKRGHGRLVDPHRHRRQSIHRQRRRRRRRQASQGKRNRPGAAVIGGSAWGARPIGARPPRRCA